MHCPHLFLLPFYICLAATAGCGGKTTYAPGSAGGAAPTTRAWATDVPEEQAEAAYWLAKPANSEVTYNDFQKLWDTCESVAYDYLFRIARRDYRGGVLTTEPMLSKQWFELWRKDGPSFQDVREASLGGVRRTIYFQIARNPDGSFTAAPKVIVERQSKVDSRIIITDDTTDPRLPHQYWYALRRDGEMEVRVVGALREKLAMVK